MAHDLYNNVKLKAEQRYDGRTILTTEDIGEIIDIVDGVEGTKYVVAFQDRVDEEGVTPVYWADAIEIRYA